jgi:hypothetical protein
MMNFTFWQRWRGNVMLVAVVIGLMAWSATLPSDYTPEQFYSSTKFLVGLCVAWLVISGVYCFISQLEFEKKMREIRAFQRRIGNGEFDRRGPLGGPWGEPR